MMCYIELHNTHRCSDINQASNGFREQMAGDVDNVAAGVEKFREMLESLEKERNGFRDEVTKVGVEISEKAEQLKQMIDVHKEKLMNELSSMKQKRMKEIESLREEIERQLLSVESYKKYVDEVRQKGTACDVARAASGLHDRAGELGLMSDVIVRTLADLGHAYVTFTSSNFVIDDVKETLGRLRLNRPTVKGGKLIYLYFLSILPGACQMWVYATEYSIKLKLNSVSIQLLISLNTLKHNACVGQFFNCVHSDYYF